MIGRGRRREHTQPTLFTTTTVLHNFRLRTLKVNPEGVKCPSVAMLLLLRRNHWGKWACAEPTSGQGHFRAVSPPVKSHHWGDIAQFPVAHAQNMIPDWTCDWRHFRSHYFRSHDFRLLLIAPPQIWLELSQYTTYKYVKNGYSWPRLIWNLPS